MIDFQNSSYLKLRKTNDSAAKDISAILILGEEIAGCYASVRDHVVFTTKRIIAVNVQGMTGKKKAITSIPYSRIQLFSIETSSVFDIDSELEIYVSGVGQITFEFTGGSDIMAIGQMISTCSL